MDLRAPALWESIRSVPPKMATRSSMPSRPKVCQVVRELTGSNPRPSSVIWASMEESLNRSSMRPFFAPDVWRYW